MVTKVPLIATLVAMTLTAGSLGLGMSEETHASDADATGGLPSEVRDLPPEIPCRTSVMPPTVKADGTVIAPRLLATCSEVGCTNTIGDCDGDCPEGSICIPFPSAACLLEHNELWVCRCTQV